VTAPAPPPARPWPTPDDLLLLRAALLDGDPALAAWRRFRAGHPDIDALEGDACRLLPHVYRNLRELDYEDPALGRLKGTYRHAWYQNHVLLEAGARAIALLQANGIGVMLLGGAAMVALKLRDVGAQPIDACDILVHPHEQTRAHGILSSHDWPQRLALHTSALARGGDDTSLWNGAVKVSLAGVETLAPNPTDQLLLVGASGLSWMPAPLRWIPDAVLITTLAAEGIDWAALGVRARERDVTLALADALGFLVQEFQLEVPPGLLADLRRASAGRRIVHRIKMTPQHRNLPWRAVRRAARKWDAKGHTEVTPPPARAGKLDTARLRAFRRLALDNALREIVQLLEGRGVRPLLIKGPAVAQWLYDDPRERQYGDIDLLIGPDDFETVMRGMAALDFESSRAWSGRAGRGPGTRDNERSEYHEPMVRHGDLPIEVELHRTLSLVPAPPELVWRRLTEAVQTIEVAGARVDVPAPAASTLIVVLHAAHHGAAAAPPMRDLRRAIERVDVPTWEAAAALAEELGAAPAFAAGVRLDPEGGNLADRLGLTATLPRDLRLRAGTSPPTTLGIERLITTRGVGPRLRLIASELVPSPDFMRASSRLARHGRPGLVAAYLWRPFPLARKLRRGMLAWLRAAGSP
jgi:hypothetical protein